MPDEFLLNEHCVPWSPSARDAPQEAGKLAVERLAPTHAQQHLTREIIRYARGDISGRAFLIAGHRGAGKTTAVLAAMQQAYNACQSPDADEKLRTCRPLLVRLHAPSLSLDVEDERNGRPELASREQQNAASAAAPADPRVTTPPPAAPDGDEDVDEIARHSKRFLQEMAAGIFPALIDELRRQLGRQATASLQRREIAAHVCDELTRGMTLGELRELFRRLGLLERGLLGKTDGFQELAAIHAASEAYLVVTGKLETEDNAGRSASADETSKLAYGVDGDKLLKALTPVSAATAAAFGLSAGHPTAAILVTLAILLSGWSFSASTTRALSRTMARTRSFKRDNTHASLVRRVPLLVEQLREVGFPLVFVLDELDKVVNPPPERLLRWLMRNLKSYVTERSFLCFVVERGYYEQINRRDPSQQLYGVHHTFYSESAYVVTTPDAFHRYLRASLMEDEVTASTTEELSRRKQLFYTLFRHVILNRARMHAYDVHRELRRAIESGELASIRNAGPAFIAPSVWTCRAFMQLSLEWVMSEARIRRNARDDPYFMQLEYDLLYGVCADWENQRRLEMHPLSRIEQAGARVSSDRDMLENLVARFFELLETPSRLVSQIQTELDLERVEFFLRAGEQPGSELDERGATELIASISTHGHDRRRLIACFATRKYRLIREVTSDLALGMLSSSEPGYWNWRINRRGDSPGEAQIDAGARAILNRVAEFRETLARSELARDLNLSALWLISDPTTPIEQVDSARSQLDASPQNSTAIESLMRFARSATARCQLMKECLICVDILLAVRRQTVPSVTHDDVLSLLRHGIGGTEIAERSQSVGQLITSISQYFVLAPEPVVHRLSDAPGPDDPFGLDEMQPVGSVKVPMPSSEELTRTRMRWYESIADRLLASLERRVLQAAVEQEYRRLDVLGQLIGWFPVALRPIWNFWARPAEWSIFVYSELLAEPPAMDHGPSDVPAWLRAFAAVRLGLREHAQQHLAEAETQPPDSAAARLRAWAQAQLASLPNETLRVLLFNPDQVMQTWLPLPAASTLSVRAPLEQLPALVGGRFHLVFSETDAPRPSPLRPDQYVLVRPAAATRAAERHSRREDGTLVLSAPPSLAEALRWIAVAFNEPS
jgi:hypothetical protein